MEGRFPGGVRLVLSNCTDPAREQEFNRWYEHTHIPDILKAGVATAGLRYENADLQPGEAKYLAIYEIARDDLDRDRFRLEIPIADERICKCHCLVECPTIAVCGINRRRQ